MTKSAFMRRGASIVCLTIAFASGGCALFKSGTLDAAALAASRLVPASLVAESLSIVAFQAALRFTKEVEGEAQVTQQKQARDVLTKLLAHDPELARDATGWSIRVIDDDAPNATAFAGAGILINRGLIECGPRCFDEPVARAVTKRKLKQSKRAKLKAAKERAAAVALAERTRDRVLAVALSHEISHIMQHHFEKRLRENAAEVKEITDTVTNALIERAKQNELPKSTEDLKALLSSLPLARGPLLKLAMIAGVSIAGEAGGHPFMVEQELSSDCQGAQFMREAGFEPGDALKFWNANVSREGGYFYATHPSSPQRLAALQTCIASLPKANQQKTSLASLH